MTTMNSATIQAEARFFWRVCKPGADHVIEVLCKPANQGGKIHIGYYDDEDAFVRDIFEYNGLYHILGGIQPRPSHMLDRSPNTLSTGVLGAKAPDIDVIKTIVIDIDTVRDKGIPSTDEELAEALTVADAVRDDMVSRGFMRPMLVNSGNGCHLYLAVPPIKLTPENRRRVSAQINAFEADLRARFSTPKVKIDTISDLPRMIRVPGTMNVKGTSTKDRPHRRCQPVDPPVRYGIAPF